MKILMIHNYYAKRGGEGFSFAVESQSLRELGHEVDTYTVDSETDLPGTPLALAINTIWSRKSYREVKKLLQKKKYDVLHVQNFFPLLSPSVYKAARDCGVPVVQALRNYRLLCLQPEFFRDGALCEDCLTRGCALPGVYHRCYRNSLLPSLVLGLFQEFHRRRKTWSRDVDGYVAVSSWVKQRYVSAGWDPNSIFVKHNTVFPAPDVGTGRGGYFVCVGRVSQEKGIPVLLDAWEQLHVRLGAEAAPQLKIIGDGPLFSELQERVAQSDLSCVVKLTGRLSHEETLGIVGEAIATIQPAIWHEPCGRTIIESYAKGTPVIATAAGGSPELIDDGGSGYLVAPGDAGEVVAKVEKMMTTGLMMRKAAREKFDRDFSYIENARRLEEVYRKVVGR